MCVGLCMVGSMCEVLRREIEVFVCREELCVMV